MSITHFDGDDARSDRIAAQREAREQRRHAAQSFTPVDELPKVAGRGGFRRPVPEARQAMLDYCAAHPGQWVCYQPDPSVDSIKVHTLTTYVKKNQGGFRPGYEIAVRNKLAYIRFVGSAS